MIHSRGSTVDGIKKNSLPRIRDTKLWNCLTSAFSSARTRYARIRESTSATRDVLRLYTVAVTVHAACPVCHAETEQHGLGDQPSALLPPDSPSEGRSSGPTPSSALLLARAGAARANAVRIGFSGDHARRVPWWPLVRSIGFVEGAQPSHGTAQKERVVLTIPGRRFPSVASVYTEYVHVRGKRPEGSFVVGKREMAECSVRYIRCHRYYCIQSAQYVLARAARRARRPPMHN